MDPSTYLQSWANRPFSWSESNCVHFAAEWAQTVRGHDVLERLRPLPTTQVGWAKLLVREGGVQGLVSEALGSAPISKLFAKAGDVLLYRGAQVGWRLGICTGRLGAVLSDQGVGFVSTFEAESAWSV